jgi:hypothetical protein
MRAGATHKTREAVDIGILVGFCCILNLQHQVIGDDTHPDTDDRIHNFLEQIKTIPSDGIWGIAFIAYKLWGNQYSRRYVELDSDKNFKENYYRIRQQVKEEKSGC